MKVDIHTHSKVKTEKVICVEVLSSVNPEKTVHDKFCFGVHPWDINEVNLEQAYQNIIEYAKDPNWFALGEIGLDKKNGAEFELQLKVFKKQISIAVNHQVKIIVLHSIKSHAEIFKILKDLKFNGVVLLHDYNSSIDMAAQYLTHFNTYFSFGTRLFSPSKAREVLTQIPKEKLLFETDDQEEISISQVYEQASKLLKLDVQCLEKITYTNYMKLINI